MLDSILQIFEWDGLFPPRWQCGVGWTDTLGWEHISSDLATGAAYYAVPLVVAWHVFHRTDLKFSRTFWVFLTLVFLSCGTVHLVEAGMFWWPVYRFSALTKMLTAAVSVAGVFVLSRSLPRALALRSPEELEREVAGRVHAEASLEQERHLLRTMMGHLPEAIYFKDRDGRFLRVSRRLADLLGLSDPAEAVGKSDRDFFSSEYADQATRDEQEIMRTGTAVIDKVEHPTWPNGEESWVQTTKAPLRDAGGNLIGTFGISHDVTAQKESERELRTSEERYRTLVEHSPDAIVVLDVDEGRFVDANEKAESLFGLSRDELLQRHPAELSPPTQPDGQTSKVAAREHIERALDGGVEVFDWIHRSSQEKDLACEVRLLRFPSPTDHRLLRASVTDVTWRKKIEADLRREIDERHRAEQELRRNVERTRRILESAQDAFVAMDDRGTIVDWNPQAEAVFGWPREQALGRTVAETLVPEELRDDHEQGLRRFLATGTGPVLDRRIEIAACRRNGEPFPVELTITAIPDEESWFFAAFLHDITNRKQAQAALQVAKEEAEAASRAKSEFLANMSHEIRTPMNAVIGMTELLLDTEITDTQRDYLETVLDSSESLLTIINEVLDFSKIEAGRLELEETPFSVRDQLGDALKLLGPRAAANGLELAWQVDDAVPDGLLGDSTRMRQLLLNLVGNAIKFTEQGEIFVRVWPEEVRSNSIDLHVCVRDTGIGIAPEQQEAIFEAFTQADSTTTRRFGGTGLGLTIAARIVERMQGRIWVDSEPGGGSEFHFVVPCALAEQVPRRPAPPEILSGVSVLSIDDNSTNRKIVEEMLHGWGMQVTSAASGARGLDLLHRAGVSNAPQLIITDVHMPEMDGYEFVAAVRERGLTEPAVIVLTSGHRHAGSERESALGIAQTLIKPVKQSELLEAVLRALEIDAEPESGRAREEVPLMRPLRILLAEDGLANQKLATALLTAWGHNVVVADDGISAVEAWEGGGFDLVLMDVQMPRMDGLEATREIRRLESESQHTPIVAMTARAMRGDREMCLAAGMDEYVSKPVRQRELYEAIAPFFPEALMDTVEQVAGAEPPHRDTAANATSEIVDWDVALKSVAGNRKLLAEVIAESLSELPDLMHRLERAVHVSDAATAERMAHSIRGCAATYGAKTLLDLAQSIESRIQGGDLDDADRFLGELRATLERLCVVLRRFVA